MVTSDKIKELLKSWLRQHYLKKGNWQLHRESNEIKQEWIKTSKGKIRRKRQIKQEWIKTSKGKIRRKRQIKQEWIKTIKGKVRSKHNFNVRV